MAFTVAHIAQLEAEIQAALADGTWRARTAQFGDQSVQLNSLTDAQNFLGWLRGQVAAAEAVAAGTNPHVRWAVVDKGFD